MLLHVTFHLSGFYNPTLTLFLCLFETWCWMRNHCVIGHNIKLSSAQQTAVLGSMRGVIIIKDEGLTAVTCPWRRREVLQSILIGGRDMETRGMSALLIFKEVKCHRSQTFHQDSDLSSIRRIKLSVPAYVSPLPIISSPSCLQPALWLTSPMSSLCGSAAPVPWPAHWRK